jgi:hypothetical protein
MSQADGPHTPTSPSGPEAAGSPIQAMADIVFEMEDVLNEGLCLTDALIALVEGRLTLRVKPGTVYFMTYEIQRRLERVHKEWKRLFALAHPSGPMTAPPRA